MKDTDTEAVEFDPYEVWTRDGFANVTRHGSYGSDTMAWRVYRELKAKDRYAEVWLCQVLARAESE